ncbi:sugar phosphate permease [Nocardioides albertanoniae]|uniref:Sugar phosphate permease n=1 Tax=Nocardioides albertanoniae TaxID=1175486 RepID=A0A543A4S0_9ACTN|nr:MFS transporter [Nocardioides albertanoniae]TQL67544.1 sugar phosphate permease [Nocardioides albertanoniae]
MTTTTLPASPTRQLDAIGAVALLGGGAIANYIVGCAAVALPSLVAETGIASDVAGLALSIFSVGFAAVLVLGGRLGDRFGRRRLFGIGLAALAVTSVGVALAPTFWILLVARILQGIAAGLMLPQVLSTVQATTSGQERVRLSAWYVVTVALGATAGQLVGGSLAGAAPSGWRLAFGSTTVLAVAVLAMLGRVPETRGGGRARLDPVGAVGFAVVVVAVLVPVSLSRSLGWSWWSTAAIVVAVLAAVAFWRWEGRLPVGQALAPPVLLRQRVLLMGLVLTALFFTGYGGFVAVFGLMTQSGLGLSPMVSALCFVPFATGFIVASAAGPRYNRGRRPAVVMVTGGVAQALSLLGLACLMVTQWPSPDQWVLQPLLIVLGVAQGVMYSPLIGMVMGAVPPETAGLASGLIGTAQQLFTAVGVAVLGLVYAGLAGVSGGVAFAGCVVLQAALALVFVALARGVRPVRQVKPGGDPEVDSLS